MYRSGKDTVKNILLFNILIYLFLSHNSPNWDGCYYLELEFCRGIGSDNQDCVGSGTAYELAAMLIYVSS